MALNNLFKLEKLTIEAYTTVGRERDGKPPAATFTAMFNPESIALGYAIQYGQDQAIGSDGKQQKYAKSYPADMGLTLVLDGSGATEMGIARLGKADTVEQRVADFLAMAFDRNSDIHEPNFLVLRWGEKTAFPCRLSSLNIRYTGFNRGGSPLRAELDLKLVADESVEDLAKKQGGLKSPDVTHSRVVRAGDTLPLLAKEVYGSSAHYLWVAKENKLDGFRRLEPGQRLVFPPLPGAGG